MIAAMLSREIAIPRVLASFVLPSTVWTIVGVDCILDVHADTALLG